MKPEDIPRFECPCCKAECLTHTSNSWSHADPVCPGFTDFAYFDEFVALAARAHGTTAEAVRDDMISKLRLPPKTP